VHTTAPSGRFLGHPKGLYVLVVAELWERFSFYGMRALLIFFLTERFLFSDTMSFAVYGSYASLVYITPLIGGLLADRYLGAKQSVIFGALLMIVGHIGLALDDFSPAWGDESLQLQIFYASLAFLIVGVGLLKPNISAMVGDLYPKDGPQRDSGFTLFVLGVNFGAMVAAIACGYVGHTYGWGAGFGLAAIGMIIGLAVFLLGGRHLVGIGAPPNGELLRRRTRIGLTTQWVVFIGVLLAVVAAWQLVQVFRFLGYLVLLSIIGSVGGALLYAVRRLQLVERQQMFATLGLMVVWTIFAALIDQLGSSVSLFTERLVNREVTFGGSFQVQSAQLLAVVPFLIIVISPVFAWLWGYLDKRGMNPSSPVKVAWSLILMGAGFACLILGTLWLDANGRVPLVFLMLLFVFVAVADLLIVPIGLSAISKLAVRELVGFMMALWMLAVAVGNYLASLIAQLSALDPEALRVAPAAQVMEHYRGFFVQLTLGGIVLGVLALAAAPTVRRWMHGVR
jgi:proton-dependent oligopeptide transporter, POT family